jgi:hypothetical protein
MSRPSEFRHPTVPVQPSTIMPRPRPPRAADQGAQRSAAAGLASQPVHSGRYPIRFQNGADSGFICA